MKHGNSNNQSLIINLLLSVITTCCDNIETSSKLFFLIRYKGKIIVNIEYHLFNKLFVLVTFADKSLKCEYLFDKLSGVFSANMVSVVIILMAFFCFPQLMWQKVLCIARVLGFNLIFWYNSIMYVI